MRTNCQRTSCFDLKNAFKQAKHMGGGGGQKFAEPYFTKLPHGLVEQLNSSRMVKPEQIKIASPQAYFYRRISRAAPLRGTYIKDSNERSEDSEKKNSTRRDSYP